MIKEGTFVEIRLFGVVIHIEQAFRQLEHIVRIAGFRSFAFLHILLVIVERWEMFRDAVAANCNAPLVHHTVPEELGALYISRIVREFRDTCKTHDFRHLRIRVDVRQVVIPSRHRVQEPLVRPALGLLQVLFVFRQCVCIGVDFVHAAMFRAKHRFHGIVVESARNRKTPVAKGKEHRLRLFIAAIDIGIAEARKSLVNVVPRHPIAVLCARVSILELEPHLLSIRNAAQVTLEIVVPGIVILNCLEFAHQPFLDEFVAGCRILHCQGTQVMPQHVAIKPRPVRKLAGLRLHPRLFVKRRN